MQIIACDVSVANTNINLLRCLIYNPPFLCVSLFLGYSLYDKKTLSELNIASGVIGRHPSCHNHQFFWRLNTWLAVQKLSVLTTDPWSLPKPGPVYCNNIDYYTIHKSVILLLFVLILILYISLYLNIVICLFSQ